MGIPEVKKKLEEFYGCRVYDHWATNGENVGISCDSEEYYGMHTVGQDLSIGVEDLAVPDTKQPVPIKDGAVGEMVITSLKREAVPLVKYASGDIIQIFTKECPNCGFPGVRVRVLGRSDDMLIVKGVNIYPAAIKKVISAFIPKVDRRNANRFG